MTSWAPNNDNEPDRVERIMDDVRGRPNVADVKRDGQMIAIAFEDATRLPDGFDEWADMNDLSIRDFMVLPEANGFVVRLTFFDEVEALSPHHHAAAGLRPYFDAGVPPAAALDAWMADRGPFSQSEWARFRGVGRQTVGDRVRDARRHVPKGKGDAKHPDSRGDEADESDWSDRIFGGGKPRHWSR